MIKKIYKSVCTVEEVISIVCLLGATIILCCGAVMRTVNHPLSAINEISLCLFAWCIFLGADVAYRRKKLVFVEVIINRLKGVPQRILYAVNYLITAAFLVIFTIESIKVVQHSWVRTWSSIPTISYGWTALCMPVGCALMLITTCIQFYQYVIKNNKIITEEEKYIAESQQEAGTDSNI